jgi:hypothetical protein
VIKKRSGWSKSNRSLSGYADAGEPYRCLDCGSTGDRERYRVKVAFLISIRFQPPKCFRAARIGLNK